MGAQYDSFGHVYNDQFFVQYGIPLVPEGINIRDLQSVLDWDRDAFYALLGIPGKIRRPAIYDEPSGNIGSRYTGSTPDPSILNQTARVIPLSVASPGDPIPYVFGTTIATPRIHAAEVSGGFLYIDFLVSVGECDQFLTVFQGGEDVGLPSGWEFFTGTSGQSASSLMATAKGTTYDTLANICHFVGKFAPDESIDIKVSIQGLKLNDPRNSPDVAAYSNNSALALARIFTDSGYTCDETSLSELANLCDEDISGNPRWTIDLNINSRNSLDYWIHTLAQYCGGCHIDINAGTVYLRKDAPVTTSPVPDFVLTEDDIISARTVKLGQASAPNRVIVHFQKTDGKRGTAVVGSGGAGETSRLQLPGFSSYTMAKRYATEVRNKALADLRMMVNTFDLGLEFQKGDIALITYAPHGLTEKLMRLVDYRARDRGRWELSFTEYDPALYNSNTFAAPSLGDTSLSNPLNPPTAGTVTLTEALYTDETGVTYSRFKIEFDGVDWAFVQGYQVKCVGEQNVLNVTIAHEGAGVTHEVYTSALKQDVQYTASVKVVSTIGAISATASQAQAIAQGKLLPPGDVTGLLGYEVGNLVALQWNAAEEIQGDLRGYQIRRIPEADYLGTIADWTHTNTVVLAARWDGTGYLTAAQVAGTYRYMVRAIDTTGNLSTNIAYVRVIVTDSEGATNADLLTFGDVTNMRVFVMDGDARYAATDDGSTWEDRFPVESPLLTWEDVFGVNDTWESLEKADSEFNTEVWDINALRTGAWYFSDENVNVWGGNQSNITRLGDNDSPIGWTNHSGNTAQAPAQYMVGRVSVVSATSPITAGDGFNIRLPVVVSFSGVVVTQSGTATISATSPLDNPKAISFADQYSVAPEITLLVKGSTAKIAAADNITNTGFDLYLFDINGNLVDGVVDWQATGT